MSIQEIWTQCHFAEIAYSNINLKAKRTTDLVFSSIHSFLSHSAMVSKMLKEKYSRSSPLSIGDVLNVSTRSIVHKRKFRNNLEHYQKELKKWIDKYPPDVSIGTYNIGSKKRIGVKMVFVTHYDPYTDDFTFVDKDFNLGELQKEVLRIKGLADGWVKSKRSGKIAPPFMK